MTDEENAALVIKEGVKQLFAPYGDLINKLLGPAATELGGSWGDSARVWRWKRQARLLQEVKRFVEQSGKDIKPISTRLFFPVFEAASIEDDDEMQTRWAALLANEATDVGSVHPSFIEILRQLAPGDARLLDKFYDLRLEEPRIGLSMLEKDERFKKGDNWLESYHTLMRLGLVTVTYDLDDRLVRQSTTEPRRVMSPDLKPNHFLSPIAVKFVKACRAPKPSESSASPDAR